MKKSEIVEYSNALMEMYKAGFLDGHRVFKKPRKKTEWVELNKEYKKAFMKRFEKKITKVLKKK